MISQQSLDFLTALKQNNTREWFAQHKHEYETLQAEYLQVVEQLLPRFATIDGQIAQQRAKDALFRIYRDTRFSPDKTPYKVHMGAYLCRGGKQSPLAGYYFHLQPGGESFVAGGCWMPPAPQLARIRQEIDYNAAELGQIVESPAFRTAFGKLQGEQLKSAPKGYPANHPEIEYLKMKSFVAIAPLPDSAWQQTDLPLQLMALVEKTKPFVDFLNRAMEG